MQSIDSEAIPDDDASEAHVLPEDAEDLEDVEDATIQTATVQTVGQGGVPVGLISLPGSSRSRVNPSSRAGTHTRQISVMSALAASSTHRIEILSALAGRGVGDRRAMVAHAEIESLDAEALEQIQQASELRDWRFPRSSAAASTSNVASTSTATGTATATPSNTATATGTATATQRSRGHRRGQNSIVTVGIYQLYSSTAAEGFRDSGSPNADGS